jgi:myo-inositol 2-dehydrogenase / D-chiro-inositol 1-dehydrogenase
MSELGVGLIGTGFVTDLHAESFKRVPRARVLAVAGTSDEKAQRFAADHGIPDGVGDYRRLLERDDIDMVAIGVPNDLHREIVVAAAEAGKQVVIEKPLARTLADADAMIEACDSAGVKLMYAELICFAPKYVRAKQLIEEGAFGRVFSVKHGEQHFGPHSDWFWDGERSGGGVMMDMGCHGAEITRWMLGKPEVESVAATLGTFVHGGRTEVDDHAVVTIRYEGDRLGLIETSWAKPGGMQDSIEIIGSEGVTYADLLRGSSLLTFSDGGYGYAVEKAPETKGWTHTIYEEAWNYGIPQEMEHFTACVLDGLEPEETGRDGRVSLEVIYAAYRSAATGRRVDFPLELTPDEAAEPPYRAWKRAAVPA